ncbi:InlB B-repeat-containing protein, partial [uncultured Adlercreutzia sp.]|uniref:InlB B-repeat-containing protein n=1 Tax=uncultured Adlercreutzia sp. TaxID=875803 RepID=UPI0025D9747F
MADLVVAIRSDGTVPNEPSLNYDNVYTYVVQKMSNVNILEYINPAYTAVGEAVQSALQDKFYDLVNDRNAGGKYWNPDTQYVVWYVAKEQSGSYRSEWHVDGVVRDKAKLYLDYDANGGSPTTALPSSSEVRAGGYAEVAAPGNYSDPKNPSTWVELEKPGYEFAGWNTAADGSGDSYAAGNSIQINTNTTLYAQWTPKNSTKYTVVHYKEAADGSYELTDTDELVGRTDSTVVAQEKSYAGYYLDVEHEGTVQSGTVKADGTLKLVLYYSKETVSSYKVRYIDAATSSSLWPEKTVQGSYKYGDEITDLANTAVIIPGYKIESVAPEKLILSGDASRDVITVYYAKRTDLSYTVKYVDAE